MENLVSKDNIVKAIRSAGRNKKKEKVFTTLTEKSLLEESTKKRLNALFYSLTARVITRTKIRYRKENASRANPFNLEQEIINEVNTKLRDKFVKMDMTAPGLRIYLMSNKEAGIVEKSKTPHLVSTKFQLEGLTKYRLVAMFH